MSSLGSFSTLGVNQNTKEAIAIVTKPVANKLSRIRFKIESKLSLSVPNIIGIINTRINSIKAKKEIAIM